MSEGGLFSVRYRLGFQGNQLIFRPRQAQVHRECVETRRAIDFPVSVEGSNSSRHFVWRWLKRFPWLAKYFDGAFCLPCVFFLESSVDEIRIN